VPSRRSTGGDANLRFWRPGRGLHVVGVAQLVVLGVVLLIGATLLGAYLVTPGVGDAEQRVAAILRAHGGRDTGFPLPARLSEAVVAIEDERFWHHGAVDPIAIGRALLETVRHPGRDPGGSTIVQQLAKNLYLGGRDDPLAALGAIAIAFKLEARYRKVQILEAYLDSVYFGQGFWGATAASRGYFATAPAKLSWGQASLLAGLIQAPSAYDPVRHWTLARARQREVLHRLVVDRLLTARAADHAYASTPPVIGDPISLGSSSA
jgi:penicillin-binding protein 1A